jgi:hypothetical protein
MSERRTSVRVPVLLDTSVEMEWGTHQGRILDVSSGGCYIRTRGETSVGEFISVECRLSSGHTFAFRGKVLHRKPGEGFGMCFINLSKEDQSVLEQIIEEHRIWESLWCGVPVVVKDDVSHEEFMMPYFNTDPEQQPSFTVTKSTLYLVASKSREYLPIIKGLVQDWRKGKERFLEESAKGAIPMQPLDDGR